MSSSVFPRYRSYSTSSLVIISREHKGKTGSVDVRWIYMGIITGERESLANCLCYYKNILTTNKSNAGWENSFN